MTDPMVMLYSVVEAIAEGKIAEGEVIITNTSSSGDEQRIEIVVRKEVRQYLVEKET